MIADLHVHYPMHLMGDVRASVARGFGASVPVGAHLEAAALELARRAANYPSWFAAPGATVPAMRRGGVGVALSVLYDALDEFDPRLGYGAPPAEAAYPRLLAQMDRVEAHLGAKHAGDAAVCRSPAELDAAIAARRVAFVHVLEGGFYLGDDPKAIDARMAELARRGLAYIGPAHLIWRGLATVAPLPLLPEALYHRLFPQPEVGLTPLGRHLIAAMVAEGVLVDLTHMSDAALADTFALLDALDPAGEVPLLASHMACRFGTQERCLDDATIARVAARDGVLGVLFCDHILALDLAIAPRRTFEDGFALLCRHVDRIAAVTGSHRHAAIGSDMDGFPRGLPGLRSMADFARLEAALVDRYGPEDAERIASGNVLRVLRAGWRRGQPRRQSMGSTPFSAR